ncbi:MAG: signal peptidase [Actinomycetota bacterium]|jgi:signal peptidase I|nr:signal peptidase [Actinomycetota bacterium]
MHPVKPSTSADSPYVRLPDGSSEVGVGETPQSDAGAGTASRPGTRAAGAQSRTSRRKPKPTWAVALEWTILIVSALAIAVLIKTFLFQAFYIPSDSMVPTLKTNDRVIVNKLSYKLHPVHRGDIIVFTSPPNVDPSVKDLVKRVIALPGETVEGRPDGHIYINGKVLKEPYLPKNTIEGPSFAKLKVPADSYWVMGDNRSNSRDSRFFPEHFIRKKDIIGRVFLRIWPLNRLGIL